MDLSFLLGAFELTLNRFTRPGHIQESDCKKMINEYESYCDSIYKKHIENDETNAEFWENELKKIYKECGPENKSARALELVTFIICQLYKRKISCFDQINFLCKDLRCGYKMTGHILTCGRNDSFQLGYSMESLQPTPRRVKTEEDVSFIDVSSARYHTLGLTSQGLVYSWGKGFGGKLGLGNEKTHILPTCIHLKTKVLKIAAAKFHSLALTNTGNVLSWGSNKYGQLGLGNTLKSLRPTCVTAMKGPKNASCVSIAASNSHSCCINEFGYVYCWGTNDSNQLGFRKESGKSSNLPRKVSSESFKVSIPVQCAASDSITIVRTQMGDVYQWGLGNQRPNRVCFEREKNTTETGWVTKDITSDSIKLIDISTGPYHRAAVSSDGEVFTWGTEANLLGYCAKNTGKAKSHTTVGKRLEGLYSKGYRISSVKCAKRHSIAVSQNGAAFVWGHGDHGVLGMSGKLTYQPEPKQITMVSNVVAASAAESHSALILRQVDTCISPIKLSTEISENSKSEETRPIKSGVKSLQSMCERKLLAGLNLWNVFSILTFGTTLYLPIIKKTCELFILLNLDTLNMLTPNFLAKLAGHYQLDFNHDDFSSLKASTKKIESKKQSEFLVDAATKEITKIQTTSNLIAKKKLDEKKILPRCNLCKVELSSTKAFYEHIAGKRHRKNLPRVITQVENTTAREEKTFRSAPVKTHIKKKKLFNENDFPKPGSPPRKLIVPDQKITDQVQIQKKLVPKSGYSLFDYLQTRISNKSEISRKQNPWKVVQNDLGNSLDAIRSEQQKEEKVKSPVQSSWGYETQQKSANIARIQKEQNLEKLEKEKKRCKNKKRRLRQKQRKLEKLNIK